MPAERWEERRREIRRRATEPGEYDEPLMQRLGALWAFDDRTGPLLEALVAAVREYIEGGCVLTSDRMSRALTALDGEGGNGG
jgi:hypothetical protein